jgi:hypothetical protein
MDFVIVFFRDVLDGPLYIAIAVICSILICSCIGYLGEKYLDEKKQGEEFASKHVTADDKPLTAEEARKALANNLENPNAQSALQEAQAAVAQEGASQEPAVEQSSDGQEEEDEKPEENANIVYAIGGGQIEELLEDD